MPVETLRTISSTLFLPVLNFPCNSPAEEFSVLQVEIILCTNRFASIYGKDYDFIVPDLLRWMSQFILAQSQTHTETGTEMVTACLEYILGVSSPNLQSLGSDDSSKLLSSLCKLVVYVRKHKQS